MGRPKKDPQSDELRVLAYLRDMAPGPKRRTVVSGARMAAELGWSPSKTKVLRASMVEKGLLEVEERYAENGGRLENAYHITRKGRRMLASAGETGCIAYNGSQGTTRC